MIDCMKRNCEHEELFIPPDICRINEASLANSPSREEKVVVLHILVQQAYGLPLIEDSEPKTCVSVHAMEMKVR